MFCFISILCKSKTETEKKKKKTVKNITRQLTWRGEKKPGELRKPEGLNPGGIMNTGGGWVEEEFPTTKFTGRFCLNPNFSSPVPLPEFPPSLAELSGKKLGSLGVPAPATGEAMAPARSWEKERQSESG